jgi:hypothetical protein
MKTAGIVLLGGAAVVILYLVSKSVLSGNPFAATAAGASPSTLTPRLVGYDANGKAIYAAPTTTPYGPANTGVQSAVVNDTLLAGSLANFGSSLLKAFLPGSPATKEQVTPSSPASATLSASDISTPTIADYGGSVSQGATGVFNTDPLTGNVTVNPLQIPNNPNTVPQGPTTSGVPLAFAYPSNPTPDPTLGLSAANNPIDYASFGIPDALPPTNSGSGAGNGSYLANDYSGYNVPSTVVDLTAPVDALSLAI